jgi:hypothetical protein
MGATLANGGVDHATHERAVEPDSCRCTLAVTATAGLYETSRDPVPRPQPRRLDQRRRPPLLRHLPPADALAVDRLERLLAAQRRARTHSSPSTAQPTAPASVTTPSGAPRGERSPPPELALIAGVSRQPIGWAESS